MILNCILHLILNMIIHGTDILTKALYNLMPALFYHVPTLLVKKFHSPSLSEHHTVPADG